MKLSQNMQMKKYYLASAFLYLLFIGAAFAQKGTIQGKITDADTRLPIEGATVGIAGSAFGTSTDTRGIFELRDVPVGKHVVAVTYVGYQEVRIGQVAVQADKVTDLEISLASAGEVMEEVVVSARANRESDIALLAERKRATLVVQKIGAEELDRKGIGDVGAGLTKVVGVSMVGDKALFVRGLGDRYNNATLNGLPIPSTNPDVKVIPLDIFPTSIVKNITVLKSYKASYYGDFSGGTIDIATKDYPDRPFMKVSLSTGGNSMATGRRFNISNRGAAGRIGFLRSTRQMPGVVADAVQYDSYTVGNNTDPGFQTSWDPRQLNAPINSGFSIAAGNNVALKNNQRLGFLFSASHKNDYGYQDGIAALFNAQQSPRYRYVTQNYAYNTNATALLNVAYAPNRRLDLNITGLYVNSSSDVTSINQGFHSDLEEIMGRRNTAIQNTLLTGQFSGRFQREEGLAYSWAIGYTKTIGSMPDRTQNMFRQLNDSQYAFVTDAVSNNNRFFSDMDDQEVAGKFTVAWSADFIRGLQQIEAGVDGRYKGRAFDARQIDMEVRSLGAVMAWGQVSAMLTPEKLGDGTNGTWRMREQYFGYNHYRAALGIAAPYVDASFRWNDQWDLIAGVRVELSRQTTHYKLGTSVDAPFEQNTIDGVAVLPAATLKYMATPKANVLLSASRTISRPLFVEAAPFRFNDAAATAEREGNPHVVNGINYNLDLKYEFYPSNAELMAVSVFGKYLQHPIEYMQKVSAEPLFTFVNTKQAVVAGIELEFNRNIGAMVGHEAGMLRNLSLGFNGTYMYSRIKIDDETIQKLNSQAVPIAPTTLERPLYGASPYLLNVDLTYRVNWDARSYTTLTGTYNVFGKRLFIAGSQNAGDVYEMPVNTLNFAVNTVFNRKVGLDLSVSNVLNPKAVFNQEFSDNDLEFSSIRRGVVFGATLSYSF